jgi:hypothetical protein
MKLTVAGKRNLVAVVALFSIVSSAQAAPMLMHTTAIDTTGAPLTHDSTELDPGDAMADHAVAGSMDPDTTHDLYSTFYSTTFRLADLNPATPDNTGRSVAVEFFTRTADLLAATALPEAASLLLFGTGLIAMGRLRVKK